MRNQGMIDQKQLEVVDLLYQSVLTPDKWDSLVERLSIDLNTQANLFVIDSFIQELQSSWISRNLVTILNGYLERGFVNLEMPLTETMLQTMSGKGFVNFKEIECSHNLLSSNKVDLTQIDEWMLNEHGITARYLALINPHPTQSSTLCLHFKDGDLRKMSDRVERANFYIPHLSNLINVSRPFLLLQARFNAVLEVLDRFKLGVFLLTTTGDLVSQNDAADKLLSSKDGILLDSKNRLKLIDPPANDDLYKAINDVVSPSSLINNKRKERLVGKKQSGKTGLLIEVSAILHHDLPIGAMVIISDPEEKTLIDTSSFAELFGLTQSEQAVCQMIAEGEKSDTIAEKRNTSLNTVRGQVKSVLAKTQTSHQSDLIRLAQSINIPVDQK